MTEQEWLECTDPSATMLEFLKGKASDRRLRLFAVAGVRRVGHLLKDDRSRKAVGVAERFADGLADVEDLTVCEYSADDVYNEIEDGEGNLTETETEAASAACATACFPECADQAAYIASLLLINAASYDGDEETEQTAQCHLLRDIFGNPFRPVTIDPSILHWNDATIPKLAQVIYHDRRLTDMPILGDALEEAGCMSQEILAHCRQPTQHVKGCWVLDLVLGKE